MVRLVYVYGKNAKNDYVLILAMRCHLPLAKHPADLNALANGIARCSNDYTDIRIEMLEEN